MPLFYVDTSALVKRYHTELGSDHVDRLFADHDAALVIADFGITELTSALDRKCQEGALAADGLAQIMAVAARDLFGRILGARSQSEPDPPESTADPAAPSPHARRLAPGHAVVDQGSPARSGVVRHATRAGRRAGRHRMHES